MNCPVCATPLLSVEKLDIELDCCPSCQGVWFDEDELEILLGSAGLAGTDQLMNGLLASPPVATSETVRRCPRCRKAMRKARIGGERGAILDLCPRADGLWLDQGELSRVVAALDDSTAARDQVAEYLGLLAGPAPRGEPAPETNDGPQGPEGGRE